MELDIGIFVILFLVAFVAGFIDSIAGGGGMVTIPALMLAGIPPHQALGTNKLQGCFGSFSATLHFYKRGYLDLKEHGFGVFCVFVAASVGTICVSLFHADFLAKCLPFLLMIFAMYFLFSPKIREESAYARIGKVALLFIISLIGFYDGFFGPGTGSFFMLSFIALGGFGIKEALAQTKLYNFTSNIASLLTFALGEQVLWILGLVMGIGQFIGANIGSRVALRYGIKIIKPLIVITSLALCAKLIYEQYFI